MRYKCQTVEEEFEEFKEFRSAGVQKCRSPGVQDCNASAQETAPYMDPMDTMDTMDTMDATDPGRLSDACTPVLLDSLNSCFTFGRRRV
jgi:hypothetical protein